MPELVTCYTLNSVLIYRLRVMCALFEFGISTPSNVVIDGEFKI